MAMEMVVVREGMDRRRQETVSTQRVFLVPPDGVGALANRESLQMRAHCRRGTIGPLF